MKIGWKFALALPCCLCPMTACALLATCTVTVTGITFPNYNYSDSGGSNGLGDVEVTCTALVAAGLGGYGIALGQGNGSYSNRLLMSGAQALAYNIYTDSARQQVWGDGSGATRQIFDNYLILLTPTARHYTAFGLLPAGQNKPAGTYTDTLIVTVTY